MAPSSQVHFVKQTAVWASTLIVVCSLSANCQPVIADLRQPQELMSRGRPSAQKELKLGDAYLSGHGVGKDEKLAAYWFEKAAEAGDPWAEQEIGFFYQAGIGVSPDPARAVHWYQLAAASGLATAKTNLGVAYLWGSGVPMDKRMAQELFHEAADRGDGHAATYLGNLYFSGIVVEHDLAVAEHWYLVGSKLHDPAADFNLGTLYSVGDRAHDFPKAAQWLRKSVARGYVPAIHSLALLLENHPELARSNREALSLFQEASGYGQWRSSEALGIIYRDGMSTPRDSKAAYYYFELAILQGAEKTKLDSSTQLLSAELGPEQVAKLEAEAQEWFQDHHDAIEFLLNRAVKDTPPGLAIVAPTPGTHAGQITTVPTS
jgi:TPR repeat protein